MKFTEAERRRVGAWGWGGGMGSLCVTGLGCLSGMATKSYSWMVVVLCYG